MESAVNFAPLRPAGFVNFTGRGGARPAFCRAGSLFFRGARRGGAGRASLVCTARTFGKPAIREEWGVLGVEEELGAYGMEEGSLQRLGEAGR